MADKEFEEDDPMELVGAVAADDDDPGALDEMARTFVEEFARMGWSSDEMMSVFLDPFYRGPHTVYRSKGAAYVLGLIEAVSAPRREARDA